MKTISEPSAITPTILVVAVLAAPMMIFCTLIGAVVIGQTLGQAASGVYFTIGVYIGMVGSWVVMGAFAIGLTLSYFRHIK